MSEVEQLAEEHFNNTVNDTYAKRIAETLEQYKEDVKRAFLCGYAKGETQVVIYHPKIKEQLEQAKGIIQRFVWWHTGEELVMLNTESNIWPYTDLLSSLQEETPVKNMKIQKIICRA